MSPELVQAISRTQKLFEERKRPSDWGINIIEGSTGLESKEDWSKYYMYLTNFTYNFTLKDGYLRIDVFSVNDTRNNHRGGNN